MDSISDPMLAAVEEVASVAEELRELRDKIKQYGEASRRLNEVADTLKELIGGIGKIQSTFSAALEQVKLTQSHADNSQKSVELLVASVPDVVKRIEASDVAGAIKVFSGLMSELGGRLHEHEESFGRAVKHFTDARDAQSAALGQLTEGVERGVSAINGLAAGIRGLQDGSTVSFQKLCSIDTLICDDLSPKIFSTHESVGEVKGLLSQFHQKTSSSMDGISEITAKMLGEMLAIREQLEHARKALDEQDSKLTRQSELLDELSKKKKGWF